MIKKLSYPRAVCLAQISSLLTVVFTVTLLLGSAPAYAQLLTPYSATALNIRTSNCNSNTSNPPGLCQPAPACNNGAGPNPDNISASITLHACGGHLKGSGTGSGFRPGASYTSFLYKKNTCSRFPDGMTPYVVNIPYADNDFVMLGIWTVNTNGTATLSVERWAPTTISLNDYHTVSVDEIQAPNTACFQCILDPGPQISALRACGMLSVVRDCAADTVCICDPREL